MGSSANRGEEDNRRRTPPAPTELARWLLTDEAGEHPSLEEVGAVAARVYERLRERLTVFLGQQGFASLWARAMYLAQRQFRSWDETAGAESPDTLPPGLHAALRGRGSAETRDILIAAFASFIALLFTFIGEEVGFRLIRQLWPELPPGEADADTEGATQ
jgi:hypothetical protein